MFAHDTFTSLFGTPRPGELEVLAGLVRAALREGYAVVLNEPGTKKPLCPLNANQRKLADRAAQDAAAQRGEPHALSRRHPCGIHHALTAADAGKVTGLLTRLTKAHGGTPNIGLEPGRSRLLVADMDTAEQRDAFLSWWAREDAASLPDVDTLYTVRSPGVQREDGTWAHSDGGHLWFTIPDGLVLPVAYRGVLTDEGGWSLIWSGLQVLVPPSVRKEGPYRMVGSPRPAPRFVLERIEQEVVLRTERERLRLERHAAREASGEVDPVDAWAADTPWAALLEPRGWSPTGRVDTCSCPTWTAPGPHGSPKSATAHDEGCAVFDTADGHAPLHVWTDNLPDYLADAPRTITKLTHEAHADHEGSESAAVIGLGLATSGDGQTAEERLALDEFSALIHEESTTSTQAVDNGSATEPDNPRGSDVGLTYEADSPTTAKDEFDTPENPGLAKVDSEPTEDVNPESSEETPGPWYDANELGLIPPPEPLITGVLDHRTMTVLAGKFGTYKTFLALDWAHSLATGTPWAGHTVPEAVPVVYIAAEGVGSFDRRLTAWQEGHGVDRAPAGMLTIHHGPINVGKNEDMSGLVGVVKRTGAKLVIVDTLSRCAPGLEENEASKVAAALERLFMVRDALGVAVLVLHHTGHQGLRARGSSVLEDNADASWVIRLNGDGVSEDRGPEIPRTLMHRKSKDGEIIGEKPMTLKQAAGSAYLSFDAFETARATRADAAREGLIAERLTDLEQAVRKRREKAKAGTADAEPYVGTREAERMVSGAKDITAEARRRYLEKVSRQDQQNEVSPGTPDHLGAGHPNNTD